MRTTLLSILLALTTTSAIADSKSNDVAHSRDARVSDSSGKPVGNGTALNSAERGSRDVKMEPSRNSDRDVKWDSGGSRPAPSKVDTDRTIKQVPAAERQYYHPPVDNNNCRGCAK